MSVTIVYHYSTTVLIMNNMGTQKELAITGTIEFQCIYICVCMDTSLITCNLTLFDDVLSE